MRIYSDAIVLRLTETAYDAALAPDKWEHFLNELGATFDAHALSLSSITASDHQLRFQRVARFDPGFLTDYQKHYWQVDPWVRVIEQRRLLRPGLIDLGERYVSKQALIKTEFYNDLGRQARFVGGAAAALDVDSGVITLSFSQYGFGQFGSRELEVLQVLLPHLRRALQIHCRVSSAAHAAATRLDVLDQVPHGILFVSATGTVTHANRAAEEILRSQDGILLDRGELRAGTASQTDALRIAIAAALRARDGVAPSSPVVTVLRPSGRLPYSVLVIPQSHLDERSNPTDAVVAMFITDPERIALPGIETVRRLWGLTLAEARLLLNLTAGQTVEESAEQLDISRNTARTRLKTIFAKTDTHRQAELIRLVLTTAPASIT